MTTPSESADPGQTVAPFPQGMERKLLTPSIPLGFISDALRAASHRDWDVDALLATHGLSKAAMANPDTLVSIERYSNILRSLGRATDDALYGFLRSRIPIRAFALLCYGLVGCRSLQEVVTHTNEHYALFTDDLHWELHRDGGRSIMVTTVEESLDVDYRFVYQSLLLMALRIYGWMLGEDIRPLTVQFSFSPQPRDKHLEYLFGTPIEFSAAQTALHIPRELEQAVLACNRDQISQMLRGTKNLFLISRWRNPLSQEIRRMLISQRASGWMSVEDVAESLELTPNQLWRQLRREDSSFLEIRDQLKRDYAIALLENPGNTVEAVAEALSYSDVSAFRKAFRKWTGSSPKHYRQQLGQPPAARSR